MEKHYRIDGQYYVYEDLSQRVDKLLARGYEVEDLLLVVDIEYPEYEALVLKTRLAVEQVDIPRHDVTLWERFLDKVTVTEGVPLHKDTLASFGIEGEHLERYHEALHNDRILLLFDINAPYH